MTESPPLGLGATEQRCWSVSPDAISQCARPLGHGGRHQDGGLYWSGEADEDGYERDPVYSTGWSS